MFGRHKGRGAEAAKIIALNALRTDVMIADIDLNITYMNSSVLALMQEAEADLKKELPRFSVSSLIGSNIDIFDKNPAHQRKLSATLEKPYSAMIRVGPRVFDLLVSPLIENTRRIGFVVEWSDARPRLQALDDAAQIVAINRSQAVVEFSVEGIILSANDNFLKALGYQRNEVLGKHHRMFVEPATQASQEYAAFWERLRRGEYQAGQFKRVAKSGKEVWIDGAYNPVLDAHGNVVKVVKFATDITPQVTLLGNLKTIVDQNFGEIDGALSRSSEQAQVATAAVQNTAGDVEAMAASAEELAASVREIADTMAKSKTAVDAAHRQLTGADKAIQKLSAMLRSMVGIIGLIREIAGQINLLALNATIESARAGDAGKGFAVVASEVKSLARQAGSATDKIAQEIDSLQVVSDEVVTALGTIGTSISSVMEYVTATAGAVEEQSVVTQEMSTAMQKTSGSVAAINDNMAKITSAVQQVGESVSKTRNAAQVLVR
jgi:PAS domain S-box-containing protein